MTQVIDLQGIRRTRADGASLTLNRVEATALDSWMTLTGPDASEFLCCEMDRMLAFVEHSRESARGGAEIACLITEGLVDIEERVRVQAQFRTLAGWWDYGSRPAVADMKERYDGVACPDEYVLSEDASATLVQLFGLEWSLMSFELDEDDRRADGQDEHQEDRELRVRNRQGLEGLAQRLGVVVPGAELRVVR